MGWGESSKVGSEGSYQVYPLQNGQRMGITLFSYVEARGKEGTEVENVGGP